MGPAISTLLEAVQPDVRRYARISCMNTDDAHDAMTRLPAKTSRRMCTVRALFFASTSHAEPERPSTERVETEFSGIAAQIRES